MASDARMGETPLRWRRAQDTAQDARGMESSGVVLPQSTVAELGLPGYQEPGKLSYGTEKGRPWRGSEGCLGLGRGLTGGRLGCPYPPAPPCLRDALCRPKDGAELPPLLPPRNGQPKAGWAEPCKEHPGPRWAEAVLAPLALYSHAYHRYPLPFPGLETQRPGTSGKPCAAAGDGAGDPPPFRHCPFLVEAKHSPFLLSSLLPTGPPADPPFGGGGPEGPGTMGDGRFTGVDWRLGSYAPTWGQPLYVGLPPRCKAALTPFDDCSSSGNKEFYPKKEPGFHSPAKDQAPSQLLGKGQEGQDGDGEGESAVPDLPGPPWRDGRVGGSSAVPAPHTRTPPPSASHPLFLLQPGAAGGCGGPWVGARPHAADFPLEPGPGRPSEPKDEHLSYQSLQPGSPLGPGEPDPSPPLTDGHYPPAFAKPEPSLACLCTAPGCDGCSGVGCGALGPFEPTLGIAGGHFPCPPSNHTKLKKTWLTRHSEQSLPRCKAPRRDGGPEPGGDGKRSAKRPHGTADGPRAAGEGAGAAKRGAKTTEHMAVVCPGDGTESGGDPEKRRMELGEEDPPTRVGLVPREPWCLQSVPCTALPESIPRCCACAAQAAGAPEGEEEEDHPKSTCRLLHFRRLAFGDSGELRVDGFCTLGEAEGEMLQLEAAGPERGSRSRDSSLCLAKYLLGVLGDPFCQAVRRDRDTWPGAPGGPEGVMAWRRGEGAPQLCDACRRGFFNSHWSCARCGFQLCPDCHRSRREADGHEGPMSPPECIPGQDHHVTSLVPTQFVPTRVLTRLWKLLHEVRAKFGIESHCPCGEGAVDQTPGSRQETPGAAVPTPPPSSDGQADTSRPIKEESPEGGSPSPGQPPPRGAMQTATLCDLLASTAVKLCLGQDGVRMAFAPVSPALPSDNRLTSILDSIIARVVERKIQERQAGGELSPPSPPGPPGSPSPPASHCILAPSGLLWLHDPGHASNYKLFQEHWRQGQPVLVSGLQKRLEGRLWGPESFRPSEGEQAVEAVNLRAPASRVRLSSQEFWDGFAASAASPELEQGGGDLLKLESGFGDMELCRATNLSASLPLPEYCRPTGRLNLAAYLRGRRWLCPRVCVAYGVHPQDRSIGTKNLMVEATDSISVLVHAAAWLPEQPAARQDVLLQADADGMDALLKERLWDAGSQPGALWHIFRAEDAGRIRDFLRKACEDQGQEGAATAEPPSRYLDFSLRRRLREECGVSGWTLLQFLGDAVLVPAGAPHQVQTLTSTISVEQRFLSPENAVRLRDHSADPLGTTHQLHAQLDGVIFSAVREAVGVLRGCK
ncbi:lysine-specific demethylase hairless [Cariama cristata]